MSRRPAQRAVAAAAGVNIETLRYYERRGLLAEPRPHPRRTPPVPAETRSPTLRVIKAAQRLGFTLDEVAELLELGRHARPRADAAAARAGASSPRSRRKIADLTTIRDTLRAALDAGCDDLETCAGHDHCPLPFDEPGPRRATLA